MLRRDRPTLGRKSLPGDNIQTDTQRTGSHCCQEYRDEAVGIISTKAKTLSEG